MQEDIVNSVLDGKDTLALLPTGGGKSVCFQVPGLILDGLCIVVSPLIALMKDQVEQLRDREILAVAIHSGMTRHEIDVVLNNALAGALKFLYVSPERLQTEIFIERFKRMNVGLIAVDEAHCISQWGYDFRPPYMQIASLRELRPEIPFIALTATATKEVQDDIVERLKFRSDAAIFKKSFARDNLSFVVRNTENKDKKLLEILQKVKGSAIIYVRSRKATQDVAKFLNKKNIHTSFYHAGLTFEERAARQDEWIKNHTRVMVATNAFGMGIDKPDVRIVIHLDLPDTLEAYYQEAGRAGRDGLRSFAAMLYHEADINNLRTKTQQSQPSIEFLSKVYQALSNYYQLAMGSAAGESFDFDSTEFSERFGFNPVELYNGLKKLEEEGLIQFNESFHAPSRLHFELDHQNMYQFQVANAQFDPIIKMLLRLYGGEMFSNYMKIAETQLAKGLKTSTYDVVKTLKHLNELKAVSYLPVKDKPQLTFILPRQDAAKLPVDRHRLEERKKLIVGKAEAVIQFALNTYRCRMQFVQEYFNESTDRECGICDICIEKRKTSNVKDYDSLKKEVLNVIKLKGYSVEELEQHIAPKDKELFVDVVRDLVDEGMLVYDSVWKLTLGKPVK
jgi:ATP-dependent DNA helicase RecQ